MSRPETELGAFIFLELQRLPALAAITDRDFAELLAQVAAQDGLTGTWPGISQALVAANASIGARGFTPEAVSHTADHNLIVRYLRAQAPAEVRQHRSASAEPEEPSAEILELRKELEAAHQQIERLKSETFQQVLEAAEVACRLLIETFASGEIDRLLAELGAARAQVQDLETRIAGPLASLRERAAAAGAKPWWVTKEGFTQLPEIAVKDLAIGPGRHVWFVEDSRGRWATWTEDEVNEMWGGEDARASDQPPAKSETISALEAEIRDLRLKLAAARAVAEAARPQDADPGELPRFYMLAPEPIDALRRALGIEKLGGASAGSVEGSVSPLAASGPDTTRPEHRTPGGRDVGPESDD